MPVSLVPAANRLPVSPSLADTSFPRSTLLVLTYTVYVPYICLRCGVNDADGIFAIGVNNAGCNFAAGVVDTVGKNVSNIRLYEKGYILV